VKIDRVQVDGFGRLGGLDTGDIPLGSLVVVLGPNEAGKSTLFTFLTSALYGFQPASRDKNPHVPWGADEAAGRIHVRLDGGGCADVERRLRSQPMARLTVDGRVEDLRNQPLPWVEHVPRAVFRQVFAVTLADLAVIDGETWARIQDKVVGSMGASDLRSAREVADVLEREAGEIWRPNRRGNQRLRDIQMQIRTLRARRTAAHERDLKVRELAEQREAALARLGEVRALRQIDRAAVETAQSLLPARRQLQRIVSLREEGGPRDALAELPADPVARYEELEAECSALRVRADAIEGELVEHRATVASFDARAASMLTRRDDIARLTAQAAGRAPDRARLATLESEVADLEARLDVAAEKVLDRPWRTIPAERFLALSIAALRDRLGRAEGAASEATGDGTGARRAGLAALLLGTALLSWGLLGGNTASAVLGAAIGAVGLTLLLARPRGNVQQPQDPPGRPEVSTLLAGIPVRQNHLRSPGDALATALERIQQMVRERDERVRSLEAARARVDEVDVGARRLASALGIDATGDADSIAHQLDREARRAERLEDAVRLAQREERRLARERDALTTRLSGRAAQEAALLETGAVLVAADPLRGLAVARARLAAHRLADELNEELQRAHPDLDELSAEIAAADAASGHDTGDPDAVALAKARLEGYEEEIEQLVKRAEALERDAAHLREMETVDAVDGEVASLREAEARLARERDRKWVLARVLREADRRFREEHQPDLLRRAGSYLEHLTGGRYERLVVDETADGNLFHLVGPGLPAPVPLAPPVSTGTLEQAYLSLRLAIVDHLDQGGERLPLFIDEVFVNWDRERQHRGLEVLSAVSGERQVFVFTCHPGVAEELERRGGRVLRLGRPG
jgi:uncharacterized protein YhaN